MRTYSRNLLCVFIMGLAVGIVLMAIVFATTNAFSGEKGPLKLTEVENLSLQNLNLRQQNLSFVVQQAQRQIDKDQDRLNEERAGHIKKIEKRLKIKLNDYIVADDGSLLKKKKER